MESSTKPVQVVIPADWKKLKVPTWTSVRKHLSYDGLAGSFHYPGVSQGLKQLLVFGNIYASQVQNAHHLINKEPQGREDHDTQHLLMQLEHEIEQVEKCWKKFVINAVNMEDSLNRLVGGVKQFENQEQNRQIVDVLEALSKSIQKEEKKEEPTMTKCIF